MSTTILETSINATITLDDGSTVHCFQQVAEAFKLDVDGAQVIVLVSSSQSDGLSRAELENLVTERAKQIAAAGGRAQRL